MAYYFRPFPLISYDIKKNNRSAVLTNIMSRFKIVEAFQRQEAIYYSYTVKDEERAGRLVLVHWKNS
jgi:hypothetical protein